MAIYNAELKWIESDLKGTQVTKYKTVYGIHASNTESAIKQALAKVDSQLAASVVAVWAEPEEE